MSDKKIITLGLIFDASSANYGEGMSNVVTLKKITRGNKSYTTISRQALLYDIRNQLRDMGFEFAPVTDGEDKAKANKKEEKRKEVEAKVGDETSENKGQEKKSVIQFHPDATIDKFLEMDFFGYMRTKENSGADTRTSIARVTPATSLYPFAYDTDFLTNAGMSKRIGKFNSIVNIEKHSSLYEYTITIDLEKVGVEDGVSKISNDEKARRVSSFLRVIENLYRDIQGRRENLSPVFAIGGLYPLRNNYFNGRLRLKGNDLALTMLEETVERDYVKEYTKVGILSEVFPNEDEIRNKFKELDMEPSTIHKFFKNLIDEVNEYYQEKEDGENGER